MQELPAQICANLGSKTELSQSRFPQQLPRWTGLSCVNNPLVLSSDTFCIYASPQWSRQVYFPLQFQSLLSSTKDRQMSKSWTLDTQSCKNNAWFVSVGVSLWNIFSSFCHSRPSPYLTSFHNVGDWLQPTLTRTSVDNTVSFTYLLPIIILSRFFLISED